MACADAHRWKEAIESELQSSISSGLDSLYTFSIHHFLERSPTQLPILCHCVHRVIFSVRLNEENYCFNTRMADRVEEVAVRSKGDKSRCRKIGEAAASSSDYTTSANRQLLEQCNPEKNSKSGTTTELFGQQNKTSCMPYFYLSRKIYSIMLCRSRQPISKFIEYSNKRRHCWEWRTWWWR